MMRNQAVCMHVWTDSQLVQSSMLLDVVEGHKQKGIKKKAYV